MFWPLSDKVRRMAFSSRIWLTLLSLSVATAWSCQSQAADLAFGEYLSGECTACHRKDGQEKGIPAIIGWPEDQFIAAMNSYKSKDRTNPVMQTIAGKLSGDELAALAAYYATLKPQ